MSPKNVVFKKICKDKSVGVYMGKRDFVDRVDSVDPVGELVQNKSSSHMLYVMSDQGRPPLSLSL
uniref:Uncharacterized protein n=1 Tax=Seriola lalandi dorsalis TaxID=1841481 RepID=A0A3B4YAP6_SERLL